MNQRTRIIITLISSFLVCISGTYRLLTETLSGTPLVVAYIFAITGFIGVVANGIELRKVKSM